MFKQTLYVATALITFAFTVPVSAQDFSHENRGNRYEKQHHEREDRYEQHDRNHYSYRAESHHRVEYRDDRRYARDYYYSRNEELHLLSHIVIALANR